MNLRLVDFDKYLKKVTNTCDVEKARRTKAIRVVRPPLRTAGPKSTRFDICHHQYIINVIMREPIVATERPALSSEEPEDAR